MSESSDFKASAKVICDSISESGNRLTTFEVKFHRFVLAEFNTHRLFSRNSASSRAISAHKARARVASENVYPSIWTSEQKGMQGGAVIEDDEDLRESWDRARDVALREAEYLASRGVHKSIVNRLLEPFMSHTVIVSATDYSGFWAQRCSPLAQPEIRDAADAMHAVFVTSTPKLAQEGDWHLPYIAEDEMRSLGYSFTLKDLKQISAARCARVSYLTQGGVRDFAADYNLYKRLVEADPAHASPLEHVATPLIRGIKGPGNFKGWYQLRHEVGLF